MVYSHIHKTVAHHLVVAMVITGVMLVSLVIFLASGYLRRHLSPTALAALNRGMGMIVAAIAVEFIFAGVQSALLGGGHQPG